MNKKKLIPKCQNPAGSIEYVGMPKEEFDWMNYMFWNDPDNPKYKWFLQYAKNKYGRQGDIRLPEVVIEAKRPEKTLAENAKENIEEVKQKWNNLPTDSKVDLALTGAGFVPGLDVAADVVDLGRSVKKGEWGNASLALLGLGLPVSGQALKQLIKKPIQNLKLRRAFNYIDDQELFYYNLKNMYEKEFTTAPTTYIDEAGKQKMLLPKTTGIHQDNNPFDSDFDYAWIDSDLMLRPRKGESTKVWYQHNRPYYRNEFWERIIKTPSSDINGSSLPGIKIPFWEGIKVTEGANMRNSEAMVFNPLTQWYDRVRYALPSTNIIIEKQGGRLIPKHNKGNKVAEMFGIDTSKFTKNPSSTRQDSKKVTNPNEQRNKLTKKKHASYINSQFVNARPTSGFITFPRKKIIESEYKNS